MRQPDQDMRGRPGKAGVAPADGFQPERRQRPADGGGKARDQRDAGDRAARRLAIDAPERAEGRVVQAEPMPTPSTSQATSQHRNRMGEAEQCHPAASIRLEIDSTDRPPTRSICRPMRGPSRAEITSEAEKAAKIQFGRTRDRARSDRPGSPADSSSKPTPGFAWCRARE